MATHDYRFARRIQVIDDAAAFSIARLAMSVRPSAQSVDDRPQSLKGVIVADSDSDKRSVSRERDER